MPFSSIRHALLPALILLAAGIGLTAFRSVAEEAREIPPPAP